MKQDVDKKYPHYPQYTVTKPHRCHLVISSESWVESLVVSTMGWSVFVDYPQPQPPGSRYNNTYNVKSVFITGSGTLRLGIVREITVEHLVSLLSLWSLGHNTRGNVTGDGPSHPQLYLVPWYRETSVTENKTLWTCDTVVTRLSQRGARNAAAAGTAWHWTQCLVAEMETEGAVSSLLVPVGRLTFT